MDQVYYITGTIEKFGVEEQSTAYCANVELIEIYILNRPFVMKRENVYSQLSEINSEIFQDKCS